MNSKPNLFIVGSPKCGTTALAEALQENDAIFLSKLKEPNFFLTEKSTENALCIEDLNEYEDLFRGKEKCNFRIDASTSYFIDPKSPKKIFEYNEKAKVIVLLRDPFKRSVSHYNMEKYTYQREHKEIEVCLKKSYRAEYFGMLINPYLENSFYYKHLKKWQKVFSTNLLVASIEDPWFEKKIANFLNIDEFYLKSQNSSKRIRNSFFARLSRSRYVDRLRLSLSNKTKQLLKNIIYRSSKFESEKKLSNSFRKEIKDELFKDNARLESLYNIDTSKWN